jgi:hypothetical protein
MALFGKGGGASGGAGGGLKSGFREMKWGDQPRKDMEVLDDRGDEKFCRLEKDDLTWGGAPLEKIVYLYWENRLSDAYIEIGPAAADRILKDLMDGWGRPTQPNKFIEDLVWHNKATGPEATEALFSRNPSTRGATLTISSSYIKAKKALAKGRR